MIDQTTALAFLMTAHETQQAARPVEPVVTVFRNVSAKEVRAMGKAPAPIPSASPAQVMPTLTAESFMKAMRAAGVRRIEGKVATEPHLVRDDKIAALAAYTGLAPNAIAANFGTVEQDALARANREIRAAKGQPIVTGPSREEQRAANRSAKGFVAGMPDYLSSKVRELQAREAATAEELIDAEKSHNVAEVARLMALLSNVRDELAKLGY